jgi:hypothetical protein
LSLILQTKEPLYILFVAIYGIDASLTIAQRLLNRENIFEAHRTHLYQYLANELGYAHVKVSLGYALVQLLINSTLIYYLTQAHSNHSFSIVVIALVIMSFIYLGVKKMVLARVRKSQQSDNLSR